MPTTTSIAIPNGIFQAGATTWGPLNLATDDDEILVVLDRTPNQGLNTKTPATTVGVRFEMLLPGDPTWQFQGGGTFEGGIRTDPEIGQLNTDYMGVNLWQPGLPGRQIRLLLTVAGSSVRLSGTLKVGTSLTVA